MPYTSRLATLSAFSWMNSRRGSTMSPISLTKISSASSPSLIFVLRQRPRVTIERRLPQLFGVHFAQSFVALDVRNALLPSRHHDVEQIARHRDLRFLAPARKKCRPGENLVQRLRMLVEPARLVEAEEVGVEIRRPTWRTPRNSRVRT